jgi:DNA-binding NtrC family response regulator
MPTRVDAGNATMTAKASILIVDDELAICELTRTALAVGGLAADITTSPSEAIRRGRAGNLRVVISDISMPGLDGLELLGHMQRLTPSPRVILVTGHGRGEYVSRAVAMGAHDYFFKPLDLRRLVATVREALAPADEPMWPSMRVFACSRHRHQGGAGLARL